MTDARTAKRLGELAEVDGRLRERIEVLEQKLNIALHTIALISVSAQPGIEWMDASLAKIDDPRKIGVPRK